MRSRYPLNVLGIIILTAVILTFVGCGSGNDVPTNTSGSNNDPEFLVVQDQVEYFVDSTVQFLLNGFNNLSALADEQEIFDPVYYGPIDPANDVISANYVNGWHIIYISRNRTGYATSMRDSVKFFSSGSVQQSPVNIDSLYYKHEWNYNTFDTNVTRTTYEGRVDFRINGFQNTNATFNGSHDLTTHSKQVSVDSTVWRDIVISAEVSNISVAKTVNGWTQGCPSSGNISATLDMTYKKDNADPVTVNWTVNISFTNGTMYVTVQLVNTTWTYSSSVCTTP